MQDHAFLSERSRSNAVFERARDTRCFFAAAPSPRRQGQTPPRCREAPRPPVVSFDHLVGAGEEGRRNCEAEGVGGLRVYHQFELCRLLDGQVGWIAAFRFCPRKCPFRDSGAVVYPIADEPACRGVLTTVVNSGNVMSERERDQPVASAVEEWVVADDESG